MANIIFSEASNLNDSVFGKSQAPIRFFLEKRGEAFEQESISKQVFNMETSSNALEKFASMTAMDGPQPVGENGAYPTDGFQESYSKTFEHMTWKNSFSISQEIIEDNKTLDLKGKPEQFISSHYRVREHFGAALMGGAVIAAADTISFRGYSFSIVGADGDRLFSTSHTPKIAGGDQSNRYSNAFTATDLGKVETAMQLYKDDNGNILDVSPDTIIIPDLAALKAKVFAAVGSDKEPDTGNNAHNYHFGRWTVVVWPQLNQYITAGTSPWILMDSKYNNTYKGAVWLDRVSLTVRSEIDPSTDANIWKGRSRWSAGFVDWRPFAVGGIAGATAL
jgi:hypothetical protein